MSTHDETPIEPGDEFAHESDHQDGTGSVERYVRLHGYIEQLLQDAYRSPVEPFPSEDADAYHMAAFLRAAADGASDPDPDFVANLHTRLFAETTGTTASLPPPAKTPVVPVAAVESFTKPKHLPKPTVSRRMLLGAGLGATAAAVGVAAGIQIERNASSSPSPSSVQLVPEGGGAWIAVAAVESIPLGNVKRFETDFVIGFIRHTQAGFSALSGTCTHMGCLLLWNAGDRTFDCPCHGGRFNEQGNSAPGSPFTYKPLPAIQTKVENGQVLVYVIPPVSSRSSSGGGGGHTAEGTPTPTTTRSYP